MKAAALLFGRLSGNRGEFDLKRNVYSFLIVLFFVGSMFSLAKALPKYGESASPVYASPVYGVGFVICLLGLLISCVALARCGPALRCPRCQEPILPRTVRTPLGGVPITVKEPVCCPHCGALIYLRDCQVKD